MLTAGTSAAQRSAMAPTITAALTKAQEQPALAHKLRKPLVEKLRRERINSSIEQLKSLLGPELLNQQPDSKLEKADILEMTVCVLRQLQQQNRAMSSTAVEQGYSRCVQEVGQFLSRERLQTQTRLIKHFNILQSSAPVALPEMDLPPVCSPARTSTAKGQTAAKQSHWRPW